MQHLNRKTFVKRSENPLPVPDCVSCGLKWLLCARSVRLDSCTDNPWQDTLNAAARVTHSEHVKVDTFDPDYDFFELFSECANDVCAENLDGLCPLGVT